MRTRDTLAAVLALLALVGLVILLREGAPDSTRAWVGAGVCAVVLVDEVVGVIRRRAARRRRTQTG